MYQDEALSQIKSQKLSGKAYKQVATFLATVNNANITDVNKVLQDMQKDGLIFVDNFSRIYVVGQGNILLGKINGTAKGFAFCVMEDKKIDDVFIAPSNLNGAMHSDKVIISVQKNKTDGRSEGVVQKIVERGVKTLVGTIQVFQKFSFVTPDNKRIDRDVYIKKGYELGAKNGQKVFVTITDYDGKSLSGSVIEILGNSKNDIKADVLSIARSYELIEEFSRPVLDSAKTLPQVVDISKYPNRLDLRKDIIFTIDGDDTRDYDDAVSLTKSGEFYILGVHIADVGEYVKRGSLIDDEAYERGTSVYFPNTVLPMLPKELSNGICSLNPNVDRLTLSCIAKIDANGNVVDHKILESVIRSCERMTYGNVTKILNGDPKLCNRYQNILPTLELMAELNGILEKNRKQKGEIDFDLPEVKIKLDPVTMEVVELDKKPRTVSERMIESFMLVANQVVAEFFCKKQIPFVYRIHEAPDPDKIEAFNSFVAPFGMKLQSKSPKLKPQDIQKFMNDIPTKEMRDIINGVLLRSMQKAKYSSECLGHFGLAMPFYCHFTSPIRRYPDLTIHRIIKDYIHHKITPDNAKELKRFVIKASAQSSEREVLAQKAERDSDDYFKCRYMQNKVGQVFDAVIDSTTNFGFFVRLENTVEGLVGIGSLEGNNFQFNEKSLTLTNGITTYRIGDKVKVKLQAVNLEQRNIDFVLVK